MKPSGEDRAARAGGPWEECFEAAVQLALRAGQVSAARSARRARSDLGQSGRGVWAVVLRPRGPAGPATLGQATGTANRRGALHLFLTPVHLPPLHGLPGSRGSETRAGICAQNCRGGSGRWNCLGIDPLGRTWCGCPRLELRRVEVERTASPRASGV